MKNTKGEASLRKNKTNSTDTGITPSVASASLIFFLLDKFSAYIYNAFKDSFIGNIFTAYSKEQKALDDSYLKSYLANSLLVKRYFKNIRKYLSRSFESSLILNKTSKIAGELVTMPLKTLGEALLFFGIYTLVIYLLRLFIPVISEVGVDYAIVAVIACLVSIPMLFSRNNIANAVGKSVILGELFYSVFGFREEAFKKRTNMSKTKANLFVMLGMVLGILTFVVNPMTIIAIIASIIMIAMIFNAPEIGVLVALFCIPFLSFFEYSALVLGLLVSIILTSYIVKLIRGKRILKFELIDIAILFFGCILYFSGAISAGGFSTHNEVLLNCELLLGYFLIANLMRTEKWIRRCIGTLVTSGTIVAFIGIAQYFFGSLSDGAWIDPDYFYDIKGRAVSLFDNPNILAIYLVIILPLALYMMLIASKGRARLLGAISVTSILLCIVFTWSRGAWIAVILLLLTFFLLYSKKTLRFMLLSCFFVPFLPFLLPQSVIRRFTSIGDLADSSTMYRIYTWKGSFNVIKEFFMGGIGYGSSAFQTIYPQYAYAGIEAAEHSHNLFLQIFIGMGVVGLIAFVAVIFLFTQMNFEHIKKSKDKSAALVSIACFCAIFAALVFGLFDHTWYSYRIFFLFWAVIAISTACVRVTQNEERKQGIDEVTKLFEI